MIYAKDAMNGLELANRITTDEKRERLALELNEQRQLKKDHLAKRIKKEVVQSTESNRSTVKHLHPIMKPADLEPHIIKQYNIEHIFPYVNMQMLLGRHLGVQGKVDRLLAEGHEKTVELKEKVDTLFSDANQLKTLQANAMYQFFPAQSDGNDLIIYDPTNLKTELERFTFPRQQVKPYLCLADFVRPVGGEMDYVGFLAVPLVKV
ncbi:5-methyltetrahydrofolate--homocysteine methyltransferase [Bacillus sp. JCM 19047]|nr:5-methyltetrahydrofolate--homocysteine methyltransferase [Bacillus sp. JCM 19047]